MKTLPLSKGLIAIIDDEDAPRLAVHKWTAAMSGDGQAYAIRNEYEPGGKGRYVVHRLHRDVLGLTGSSLEVDHINGDGLDNRKANLRLATRAQNGANQRTQARPKSSRFKGVSWRRDKGLWSAQIKIAGNRRFIGYFRDEVDAARAYDEAATEAFGEFARPNLNGAFA